jgi:hypothetical protein
MVGASDVDSSSVYSTLSSTSSEDEGDHRKSKKSSKNLSGLSCFARDGFCTMALSSGSKKSTQSDSDSVCDDKVRDELPFLHQENERLGSLLDNHDDMLREAKKMRKELRASLEDARTRVAELETQILDSKLEIDSLKASPIVSDEVDCADCSIFLADLALFKEKHASNCEELDVLRVEVAELKSRPALLGACTSCPVLHAKIDEMHAYTASLEAKLKVLTPKFGTERSLNCGPSLVKKSVRKKEGFSRKIRQRSPRSAVGFRSARKLFALILRDCVMTWPERKGRMDG